MFFKLFNTDEKELERAKQQLIHELERNDIRYLLKQMNSKEVYSDLILKRRKTQMSFSNTDDVSWYAFVQSTKLNSTKDKYELLGLLDDKNHLDQRKNIYCCLSSLCANTNDKELFRFLIKIISKEEEDNIRVAILSRLEGMKKDADLDLDSIKELVTDGTDEERSAAIKALANTNDPDVEDLLLTEFKISNKHIQSSICSTLKTIGTIKAIPILKNEYKMTRDGWLRSNIEFVIEKIEERNNSDN